MKDPQSQRIKELEAQLAKKEQELLVFKKFIEIAERELKVEIVKSLVPSSPRNKSYLQD